MNAPEIKLTSPKERLLNYSELTEVFSKEQLQAVIDEMGKFEE